MNAFNKNNICNNEIKKRLINCLSEIYKMEDYIKSQIQDLKLLDKNNIDIENIISDLRGKCMDLWILLNDLNKIR